MVSRVCRHSRCTELWKSDCNSILPWDCGSSFLPRSKSQTQCLDRTIAVHELTHSFSIGILPPVMLVHAKRAGLTYRRLILRTGTRNRILRLDCSWCVLRPRWGSRHTRLAVALHHRRRRQLLCCNGLLFPAARLHRIQDREWQVALYRRRARISREKNGSRSRIIARG